MTKSVKKNNLWITNIYNDILNGYYYLCNGKYCCKNEC